MKNPLRNLLALSVFVSLVVLASAAPLKVHTGGAIDQIAPKLAGKGEFELVEVPKGEFRKPTVTKYAHLAIPASIKMETKEHNVQVGVVLSSEGKVLATCVVDSNCPELARAAEQQLREMQFSPATVNGTAIPFFFVFPVSYRFQPQN